MGSSYNRMKTYDTYNSDSEILRRWKSVRGYSLTLPAHCERLTFSLTSLTTSHGRDRKDLSNRYLEIRKLPKDGLAGKGKYFVNGEIHSVFTFQPDENGDFVGRQRDGRSFKLSPIVPGHLPAGITWTMPEEYPLFRACFGLSREAEDEVEKIRASRLRQTSFGQFREKFSTRKDQMQRCRIKAKATITIRR